MRLFNKSPKETLDFADRATKRLESVFQLAARIATELPRHVMQQRAHRLQVGEHEKQIRSIYKPELPKQKRGGIGAISLAFAITAGVYLGNGNDPVDMYKNFQEWKMKHGIEETLEEWIKSPDQALKFFSESLGIEEDVFKKGGTSWPNTKPVELINPPSR